MPKLTKRSVESFGVRAKSYFEWDSEVKGFGVRIMPSGTKTYQVQYRKGGRTRRASIGRHGNITAEQARAKAKEIMGQLSRGANLVEDIAQLLRAPTISALCERFFVEHALERCKPTTQSEYRRAVDKFIIPAFGSFKIVDVERRDLAELHHKFRDIPYQANRTLGVLSKMFNLAEIWGLRPDGSNPCRHVPKYREKKRERYLSQYELQTLGQVLADIDQDGSETPYIVAAFRLLILTGCRLGEIQTLKWNYVTDAGMELPDSKTGARRIPLPQAARAVLSALPRRLEILMSSPESYRGNTPPICSTLGGASESGPSCSTCAFTICVTPMHPMRCHPACRSRWSAGCSVTAKFKRPCDTHIWRMIQ